MRATAFDLWLGFATGCLLILCGILRLTSETPLEWRGGVIEPWVGWVDLPIGLIIIFLSLRAILRGEGKPRPVTDEEIARAKAGMDAMYLREHGELPKSPDGETPESGEGTGAETDAETGEAKAATGKKRRLARPARLSVMREEAAQWSGFSSRFARRAREAWRLFRKLLHRG